MNKLWIQHYDPGVTAQLEYPDITTFHYLDAAAEKYPEKACTIYRDQTISFTEMRELSNVLARGLVNLGVKVGDRGGIILPNIPQFVLASYAVLKAGGGGVAINPQYKPLGLEFPPK